MYKRSNYEGKSFAEVAARINQKYKNRKDAISSRTMQVEFEGLASLNDAVRQVEMPQYNPQMFQGGGQIPPYGTKNYSTYEDSPHARFTPIQDESMFGQSISLGGQKDFSPIGDNSLAQAHGQEINLTPGVKPELNTISAPERFQFETPDLSIPTKIGKRHATANFNDGNNQGQQFTMGDKINFATGAMQGLYNQIRGSQEIPAPRTNPGFAAARYAANQMGISTQAEQNARMRNRNSYINGVNQNSPNSAIRNANLQGIFASDDMNTSRISADQRKTRNKVQEQLVSLSIQEGQDWQNAMLYRDQIKASQNQLKDTGMQQMFGTLAKIGDQKNYYKSILDAKKVMRDMPGNFHYGEGQFDNELKYT